MKEFVLKRIYWACGRIDKKHYVIIPFINGKDNKNILLMEYRKVVPVKVNACETLKQLYNVNKLDIYSTNFLLYNYLSNNYNKKTPELYNDDKTVNEISFDFYINNVVLNQDNIKVLKKCFEKFYKTKLEENEILF